jgi:membrane protein YdbS with pleckstrin-like domain
MGLSTIIFETGSAIAVPANSNDKQAPNYVISLLFTKHAQAIAAFILGKMGLSYSPNSVPLVKQLPLSRAKPFKRTISRSIWLLVLCVLIGGIVFVASEGQASPLLPSFQFLILGYAAFVILILIYQIFYLKYYYYDVSRTTLTIRKGVFGRRQIFLPFEKIQNVFVDQDLLDRIFGLYDVHVSTVGMGSARMCHIDGLRKENAEKMKSYLLQLMKINSKK